MSLTGLGPEDPQRVGVPIADLLAGMNGASGLVAALAERTGRSQVVRTCCWPEAQGNHHPSIAPYALFDCRDGSVQISVGSEKLWASFAAAFGLDFAAPGFATNAERVRNRAGVIAAVERVFVGYVAADLLQKLNDAGIPAGKVRSLDQVYAWEQVAAQGLVVDVDHPLLGKVSLPGPPLRFFAPGDTAETTVSEHLCFVNFSRPFQR